MSDAVNEIAASRTPATADGIAPRRRVERVLESWLPDRAAPPGENEEGGPAEIRQGELVAPVERINEVMRPYGVEFELHESTSRIVTRLVDRDTGDLIRQIPAEEVMRFSEHLEELQGRLIDQEA